MPANLRRAGFYLEYIQNLIAESAVAGSNIKWAIEKLCSFESRELNLRNVRHQGDKWRSILCIYHNLIERGLPTYPTVEIERDLIKIASRVIPIGESSAKDQVIFRDELPSEMRASWISALVRAHEAIDPFCDKFHGKMDSKEEELFLDLLTKELGANAHQVLENQRPFSTLVGTAQAALFQDQRVDFCLETSSTKLIFEIEGDQHKVQHQQVLDKHRNDCLKTTGWNVVSISARDVRSGNIDSALQPIRNARSVDRYLGAAGHELTSLLATEAGPIALQLVVTPFAIARIQWALIWAALNGQLDLEKRALQIAIIEEDIPCGLLAVWDFLHSLRLLLSLADLEQNLPTIHLNIFRSEHFQGMEDGNIAISEDHNLTATNHSIREIRSILSRPMDLVIQISTLHVGPSGSNISVGSNPTIILNSVHSPRGIRHIESAPPIAFNSQLVAQNLGFFLNWIFRKREFWNGQIEIISRSLALQDVIGLLQTGGGKSLCYQMAALLQPGLTIIVEPLRSIMLDQTENLRQMQIDFIAHIASDQETKTREETIEQMAQGKCLMVFISPERFQIRNFRNRLQELCLHTTVQYLVIDEVHCVSEWGHDFRPSYLDLAHKAQSLCVRHGHAPSIIALTGTASWVVLNDIQREIDVTGDESIISPDSFDRPELKFEVIKRESVDKPFALMGKLRSLPQSFGMTADLFFQSENAGIIFCPHVNGEFGIESVARLITLNLPEVSPIGVYAGDMPKSRHNRREWDKEKIANQEAFKRNKLPLMVTTKAFGMGIDKRNIRYTIHYNIPTSLEAFYQECGRAGRDGENAQCAIIFSGDPSNWKALQDPDLTASDLADMVKRTTRPARDDIYRMLYFHSHSWQGEEQELKKITGLLNAAILPKLKRLDIGQTTDIIVPFDYGSTIFTEKNSEADNPDTRAQLEKALYRLSLLGIVTDYTLDHRERVFELKVEQHSDKQIIEALLDYIERYKPAEYRLRYATRIESAQGTTTLEKCLSILLNFVYEEIEKKRRRAIMQIAEVANTCTDDVTFRGALLDYLEKSKFTQSLIEISARIIPGEWVELASKVDDIDSSRQLLGGCRRALESYPDHPGLQLLSAFARIMIPGVPDQTINEEFQSALKLVRRINHPDLPNALARILMEIGKRRPSLVNHLSMMMLEQFRNREIARTTLMFVDQSSQSGALALQILLTLLIPKIRYVTKVHGGIEI